MFDGAYGADCWSGRFAIPSSDAFRHLPPSRVEPDVRVEFETVLRDGESLILFVEAAVVAAAARRRMQA